MDIVLTKRFARDGEADEFDTRQIKKVLNRLGYYQPHEDWGITEIPDDDVFEALKAFQKANGLTVNGNAKPGDDTVQALNKATANVPDGFYIWRSVEDGKTRAAHALLNRTTRSWALSPDPGEDYNCRCWAEIVPSESFQIYDPPLESLYPEALLLPLLGLSRLYTAWRLWGLTKNADWTLGTHKSDLHWGNQLKNRNWTPKQITETIKYGSKYSAPNKVNPRNVAIRYEYKGRFVVRDERTKEVLQISGPKFDPNKISSEN